MTKMYDIASYKCITTRPSIVNLQSEQKYKKKKEKITIEVNPKTNMIAH